MMDRKWERGKSIVNGQHMRNMKYQMDTEYQAYLRHQEQEREQTEREREMQASSRYGSQHGSSINSTRSYSKPWQTGMTKKEQIGRRLVHENGYMKDKYTSTVSKLPSIKKDKELLRKKTTIHFGALNKTQKSNIVSQPHITVEKKSVHARQSSTKPNVSHYRDATGRRELNWQKPKEPRKQEIQKHSFVEQEKRSATEIQPPCMEQNSRRQHDQVLTTISSTSLIELSEDLQTISVPMSIRLSPILTSDDIFNRIPEINTEDDIGYGELSINDERNENVSLSDSVSSLALSLGPQSYDESLTEHSSDSDEETSSDSETEEFPVIHRQNQDFNGEATGNRLDFTTHSERSLNNLPPLTSPRNLGFRATLPQVAHRSQNNAAFLNLRDMIELRRIGVAIASPTQEHNRLPHVAETTLPELYDVDSNTGNVQHHEYHSLHQRTGDSRNRATPGDEDSSDAHVATFGPSLSSTAPTITILDENLDLIAQTLPMQGQSERIINITPDKGNVKPKPDPEKLKRIRESLLEEDSEDEGDLCRICLTGDETTENHLLAPCSCAGSLKYVHKECMKTWLLSKIKSGAELSAVKTCEMCKQNLQWNFEDFDVDENYRIHQDTRASLNPSLYLILLLHLYQQRYEELLRLSNTRDRVNEISRRFSNLSLGRHQNAREDDQET